jgi:uncharacterized membrane protein YkvA (DUF1232 family)
MAEFVTDDEMNQIINNTVQTSYKLKAVIAGIYTVIPIDLMPEIITGPIGYIDDLAIVIGSIVAYKKFKKEQNTAHHLIQNLNEARITQVYRQSQHYQAPTQLPLHVKQSSYNNRRITKRMK